MGGEHFGQALMRFGCLCGHHHATRILVETVDNAGTLFTADTCQAFAAMVDQRIDQRPVRVARRRVCDHPRRFVDDDDVIIFEKDIQRDILRLRSGLGCWGDGEHIVAVRLHRC